MRKEQKIILLIIILLVSLFVVDAYAIDQKVYDEAALFSEPEKEVLQLRAAELSEKLSLDIVILTISDNKGKTSRDYADDYYDENGFGYGENYDGLILLINMDDREVYISTCGKAIEYFTDARIDNILDKIYTFLTDGNYGEGADAFLDEVNYYVQEGIPSNQYTYDEDTGITSEYKDDIASRDNIANRILIFLLISFAVGGVSVGIMAINNKGKSTTNQSTYLENNSFKLINSQDHHVNTRVTFVHINTDSGSKSSGRSTTHHSSSGRSHGGGGRKF